MREYSCLAEMLHASAPCVLLAFCKTTVRPCRFGLKLAVNALLLLFPLTWIVLIIRGWRLLGKGRQGFQANHRTAALSIRRSANLKLSSIVDKSNEVIHKNALNKEVHHTCVSALLRMRRSETKGTESPYHMACFIPALEPFACVMML
jgi:hypothetical protein